jgi:hypothetical protein
MKLDAEEAGGAKDINGTERAVAPQTAHKPVRTGA